MNRSLFGLLGLLLAMPIAAQAEVPERTSFVDFNTQCARCHEGECSGRLSFSSGSEGAARHLRRYLGDISDKEVQELYGLLRQTKENCAIYPFPAQWDGTLDELKTWRNSLQDGYFIPVQRLDAGQWRLEIELETAGAESWQLMDRGHDILAEGRFCPKAQSQAGFKTDADSGPLYLHLQGPGTIKRLEIQPN